MFVASLHLISGPPHVDGSSAVTLSKPLVLTRSISSADSAGTSSRYSRSGPVPLELAHVGLKSFVAPLVSPTVIACVITVTGSDVVHASLESPAAWHDGSAG